MQKRIGTDNKAYPVIAHRLNAPQRQQWKEANTPKSEEPAPKKKGKHYVSSQELEEWWQGWLVTQCPMAWEEMSNRIYLMCQGIATHFNPRSDDEFQEHVHDAFAQTIQKIKLGKLRFTRGKAPVFNLVTTTVFRILYSKMNRQKKQREHQRKFAYQQIQQKAPELLSEVEYPFAERAKKAELVSC
jgi:hypothetical protein